MGVHVMDRCNLTIFEVEGQEDLPEFLAGEQVEIVASMPCYLRGQRRPPARQGRVRRARSAACRRLNALGYGRDGSGLTLNLVYNPQGPVAAAAAGGARSRLQARARRAVTASCSTSSTRSPTCRSSASARCCISKGEFDALPRHAAARASRRESRRRDVPQSHLGRLARLSSTTATSTRCSICRWRAAARDARASVRTARRRPRRTIRSASPATASAAPPARARAAAAR